MCFLESPSFEHASKLQRSKKKHIQNIPMTVIKLQNIEQMQTTDCHVIFIAKLYQSAQLYQSLDKINQRALTIGESSDFVKDGGMLSIISGKTNMEILFNSQQLKKSPLKISSAVLELAKSY